jgi:hypothetical protein
MKIVFCFIVFAACFCAQSNAQEIEIVLSPRFKKIATTDSTKRGDIMQKLLWLSDEIGPDNSAVSRLLTNIAISMVMCKEDHIDEVVNTFTNAAIDAQIKWILNERKEIEKIKEQLLKLKKERPGSQYTEFKP